MCTSGSVGAWGRQLPWATRLPRQANSVIIVTVAKEARVENGMSYDLILNLVIPLYVASLVASFAAVSYLNEVFTLQTKRSV